VIQWELSLTLTSQLIVVGMLAYWLDTGPLVAIVAMGVQVTIAGCLVHAVPDDWHGLGWANRITLARGVLVALLAGALTDPVVLSRHAGFFAALSLLALALDGVDGWVARRTGSGSELGARFDMELDAFFILVLCLALVLLGKVGAWVVAIGAMRYAFVLAGWRLPWLRASLPESRRRKAVCVWQVAALMIALLPPVSPILSGWMVATALAGLGLSFAVDIRWLYRHVAHEPHPNP
jgi:phosphatidylglycerophosphate synthase